MSKNTLLFTLEYPPFKGGVSKYYENLVEFWPKKENIFVLNNNEDKLIKKYFIPKWLPAFYYLFKEIKKKKINYIIVGHILPLGTVAYFLQVFLKIKYSVILHGMDFAYALRAPRKKKLAKKILEKADKIICANSFLKSEVENFLGKNKKIKLVNPGIDTKIKKYPNLEEKIKNKYNLEDKKMLFSIGRLTKRKGVDMVIKIWGDILKEIPNAHYFIAGAGEDEKYLKELAKNKKNIHFLGKISEKEKWAFLNLCDVFIMPSRNINGDYEGFGIVYLEANLCTRPVIAGNSGGVSDAVKNNYNGLLVNPQSKEDIKKAILKLLKDEKLARKLGEIGKKMVLKKFSTQKQSENIYYIFFKN